MAKRKDITGEKSGRLTVVEYHHTDVRGQAYWLCECECGNKVIVRGSHVRNQTIKSCGCLAKEITHEIRHKSLVGQQFGKLTVIKEIGTTKTGEYIYECECDCENHTRVEVLAGNLTSGNTKSCGCIKNRVFERKSLVVPKMNLSKEVVLPANHSKKKLWTKYNFVGQKINYLTVLEYVGKSRWKCLCDCGNETIKTSKSLLDRSANSCGKCISQIKNMLGKKYGKLTPIRVAYVRDGKAYWEFLCDCGKLHIAQGKDVRQGRIVSCGHGHLNSEGSQAEIEIYNYVSRLCHVEQHNRHCLDGKEIDIYIPELKIGIEYNGSAFHAAEGGVYNNKDKYYHRDKFLLAREKGIHLISVFDIDWETKKDDILTMIYENITKSRINRFIPTNEIEYTDNDYDIGTWIEQFGYKEIGQEEPKSFMYQDKYKVYRCGRTIWKH